MDPASNTESHAVADATVTRVVFTALGLGLILATLFEPAGMPVSGLASVWAWSLGAWLLFCGWVYGRPEIWGEQSEAHAVSEATDEWEQSDPASASPRAESPNVVALRRPPAARPTARHP